MHDISTLIATYRATLRPHMKWSDAKEYWINCVDFDLGSTPITSVSADSLTAYALASNRSSLCKRYILYTLSHILHAGRTLWGLVISSDAAREAIRRLSLMGLMPRARSRQRRIDDDDIAALMLHWEGEIPSSILHILVQTPMRSGELAKLRWEDIDLEARTAIIRDRKHPNLKHGNDQVIPLLGNTADIIADQPRSADRPFPWTQRHIGDVFRRSAKLAGLADVRLHDLRHEGISRLFDKGWTIPQVAAVSGHRSWQQLKRYTHISPAQLHLLAEKGAA